MTEHESILRKIKRCSELSQSSNENEAAIALKQMKRLMEQHNISESHILASEVSKKSSKLNVTKRPANWVLALHQVIGQAMDCECFVREGRPNVPMQISYLGVGASPEIANYAFEVLYRKLKTERDNFIKTKLSRFKRSNKTKLADAFCGGWVWNVYSKVKNLNPNEEAKQKINAYKEMNASSFNEDVFKTKNRYDSKDSKVQAAMSMGAASSSDVSLFAATGHTEKNLIEVA